MHESKWVQETRAIAALNKLIEGASEVRNLYEAAGMPLPPPLARLFGTMNGVEADAEPHLLVSPPKSPSRPSGAKDDWIWIPTESLTETGLVLGVLRSHVGPITTQKVVAAVKKLKPDVVTGTIYNIVARIKGEMLDNVGTGWKLRDPEKAPILTDGWAWGPKDVFQKYELAAHRREVILHILRANKGGLMNMQIVNQLHSPELCRAPVTKDLVKADMEILKEQGKVRRISNSRKWTVE